MVLFGFVFFMLCVPRSVFFGVVIFGIGLLVLFQNSSVLEAIHVMITQGFMGPMFTVVR